MRNSELQFVQIKHEITVVYAYDYDVANYGYIVLGEMSLEKTF